MKRTISTLFIFLIVNLMVTPVLAQEMPVPPTAPSAPEAPQAPTAPSIPTIPTAPSVPEMPVVPTQPPAPVVQPTEMPTLPSAAPTVNVTPEPTSAPTEANTATEPEATTNDNSGSNNVGDTEINTGDANNSASIVSDANLNVGIIPGSAGPSVAIDNSGNGTGSTNSGGVSIVDNQSTIQNNNANINNNLEQSSTTGGNDASRNVGESEIRTGDANVSGTIITSANTNIDGVAVAEFNVFDDHVGDIILDFASGCISGCFGGSGSVTNEGNGSDSNNSGLLDSTTNEVTFQNNDATINNGMTLIADSGNNATDSNTGGDNTIVTGDANISANALTFANNNFEGDVVYSVVNLYGSLIGDIIFPEEYMGAGTNIANAGNGTNSTNVGTVNQTALNTTSQSNTAVINNNLNLASSTGANEMADNTGGDNAIETGDSSVIAQVLNVVNTNIIGDMWLVIVNEAGNWIGKLMGADPGATYAGTDGLEFAVDANGAITVTNAGNGSGSNNSGTVNQTTNSTVVQNNNANVTNNLNLSANTGNNSASRNTGGDNMILTGDTNIIANLVNFVNNNVSGSGRLFVTVINVFDRWLGNFRGPGATEGTEEVLAAANQNDNDPGVGGYSTNENEDNDEEADAVLTQDEITVARTGTLKTVKRVFPLANILGVALNESETQAVETDIEDGTTALSQVASAIASSGKGVKKVQVNLAWLILLAPPTAIFITLRKRFAHPA